MSQPEKKQEGWLERYLLSAILGDPDEGKCFAKAKESGITHEFFQSWATQTVWYLCDCSFKAGDPVSLGKVFDRLRSTKVGELPFFVPGVGSADAMLINFLSAPTLLQIAGEHESYASFEHYIDLAKDKLAKDKLRKLASSIQNLAETGDFSSANDLISKHLESASNKGAGSYPDPIGIKSLPYPKRDDSSMLVGNDWLNRGGAALLVSYAGQGKSSISFAMSAHWAIGRDFYGLRCKKPLRILIIQAEDDHRYMGKLAASVKAGMNLTPPEVDQMNENLMLVRDKSHLGPDFFPMIKHYAQRHQPDIIVINPIYLYAAGDITRNEVAANFIVGLETANAEQKFAYILVHHTGKPSGKDQKGNRAKVDSWETMYMGFGSSFLANYPRCTMMLEPSSQMGRFNLRFGKGVTNAGIYESVATPHGYSVPKPTDRIALKYSNKTMNIHGNDEKVIFWERDEDPVDSSEGANSVEKNNSEKAESSDHWIKDYMTIFDTVRPVSFGEAFRLAQNIDGPSKGQMQRRIKRLMDDGKIKNQPPKGYVKETLN